MSQLPRGGSDGVVPKVVVCGKSNIFLMVSISYPNFSDNDIQFLFNQIPRDNVFSFVEYLSFLTSDKLFFFAFFFLFLRGEKYF